MVGQAARHGVLRGVLRGLLTGTSVGALAGLGLIATASAQTPRPSEGRSAERNDATVTFDLPAQPLDAALGAFGGVTGIQLLYDSAITAQQRSAPVRGSFTPADALSRMLVSTGLTPRFTGPRTATLQRRPLVQAPAQAAAPAAPGTVVLDTLVVQGEKVARDYFSTYTSVGVVTGQEIVNYDVPDLQRSFNLLANVRSFKADGGNNGFVIRGLNSEGVTQPTNAAPIVSVVIDGAIQNTEATRRGARGTWDVEQVEVLRGPQSTLQGRNSLGGAVVIKTKDPTFTPELIMDGQLGDRQYASGAFAVSGPLVPNEVAFRIAGQHMRETKNITFTDPAVAAMARDELDQIRGKLLITPSNIPGLTALLTVSHTMDNPAQNAVTGPNFFARHFDASISQFSEFRKTEVNNYIADIGYEFGAGWKIQSVTAFADTQTKISTPRGALLDRRDTRDGGDFSQDLRLSFQRPDSPISGVFGLFAGKFTSDTVSFIGTSAFGPPITIQDAKFYSETVSLAAYADIRYRVWDRWTLIGGGRLLQDKIKRNFAGSGFDLTTFTPISLDENVDISESTFLPKYGVALDLTQNQTIAGTVSQGYRAGLAEVVPGRAGINQVAPEFMWAYELAYRSKWLEDRLQLNANVFYYDYKDQQIAVDNPVVLGHTFTQNAGKSRVYGAEVEGRVRLLEGLTMFASVGLLKTRFEEAVTAGGVFTGNEFPEAPTVTASLGGIYKHASGLFAGADVSFTDGYFSPRDLGNDPTRYVKAFTLVNARIGYETKYGSLTLFARNLFDEQYVTAIAQGNMEATIGDGRVFGVKGTTRF